MKSVNTLKTLWLNLPMVEINSSQKETRVTFWESNAAHTGVDLSKILRGHEVRTIGNN